MSITQGQADEAIFAAFVAGWTATTSYTFDDEPFDPPFDTSWARVVVVHGDAEQETIAAVGARKFLRRGTLAIQCFAPQGEGAPAELARLKQNGQTIFEGVSLSSGDLRIYAGDFTRIGPSGDYQQGNQTFPFDFTEVR